MPMPASRDVGGDPPESIQLRMGDEVAWSDINGVYDRDDSLKENTNPKCVLKNHHGHGHGAASSSSQRFSGNLKPTAAPIIGLQGKQLGGARRHHTAHAPAMFPKKAKTGGGGRHAKPAVPEPGSPKVSCFGKVGSQSQRRGDRALRGPSPSPAGCCGLGFLAMRRSRSRNSAVECVDRSPPPPPLPSAAARRREMKEVEAEVEEAPARGLGGMRRFSSGRRAADWAAEMEDDGRVARSGPL